VIYEYREYHILPGMWPNILEQFNTLIPRFFDRHGYRIIGAWEPVIGENDRFVYLLAWDDLAHREHATAALWSDPEWLKAFADWKATKGAATARIVNKIWKPTNFSKLQ
jgi:hypothetical protein